MSETLTLFQMEVESNPTFHDEMMKEYRTEVETLSTDELEALRTAELETLSDTEYRVHMLNGLIESRANDTLFD